MGPGYGTERENLFQRDPVRAMQHLIDLLGGKGVAVDRQLVVFRPKDRAVFLSRDGLSTTIHLCFVTEQHIVSHFAFDSRNGTILESRDQGFQPSQENPFKVIATLDKNSIDKEACANYVDDPDKNPDSEAHWLAEYMRRNGLTMSNLGKGNG